MDLPETEKPADHEYAQSTIQAPAIYMSMKAGYSSAVARKGIILCLSLAPLDTANHLGQNETIPRSRLREIHRSLNLAGYFCLSQPGTCQRATGVFGDHFLAIINLTLRIK